MKIRFDQKPEDLLAYSVYMSWQAPERKNSRILSKMAPVLVYLAVGAFLTMRDGFQWEVWVGLVVMGLITTLLVEPIGKVFQKRKIQSVLKRDQENTLTGDREVELNDLGLSVHLPANENTHQYKWEELRKMVELESVYLLFVAENTAVIIPGRAFDSSELQTDFVARIEEKLGEKRSVIAG